MRRIRRLTALLLNLVLLQLSLGGLGAGCGEHERSRDAAGGSAPHQMAGMSQSAGDAATPPCHQQRVGGEEGNGTGSPCQMPGAQGSCASMTTCAAPMLAAAPAHAAVTPGRVPVSASVAALLVGSPSAPELPPPRA